MRALPGSFATKLLKPFGAVVSSMLLLGVPSAAGGEATDLWVRAGAPSGGNGSAERPYGSVNAALSAAGPGQTVHVAAGTYREQVRSVRPGSESAPIRLLGDEGAHIRGDGGGRLVELHHDHILLQGFELSDADVLVHVSHARGVRLSDNHIHDAGSECVRIKYLSSSNEVRENRIERCGLRDFRLRSGKKNGEGVYIGTAPEQLYRNPTAGPDRSDHNTVVDNVIVTPAECVDVKEASRWTIISGNHCSGGLDPDGAGYSTRGRYTALTGNTSSGNRGAGIRLGGDGRDDGTRSIVSGNVLTSNRGYGVKAMRYPQRAICGNISVGNARGAANGGIEPDIRC